MSSRTVPHGHDGLHVHVLQPIQVLQESKAAIRRGLRPRNKLEKEARDGVLCVDVPPVSQSTGTLSQRTDSVVPDPTSCDGRALKRLNVW